MVGNGGWGGGFEVAKSKTWPFTNFSTITQIKAVFGVCLQMSKHETSTQRIEPETRDTKLRHFYGNLQCAQSLKSDTVREPKRAREPVRERVSSVCYKK